MSVTSDNEIDESEIAADNSNGAANCNANANGLSGEHHNGADGDGDSEVITSAQKKKQKIQETVNRIIAEAKALGSISIDLSFKELRKIPDDLLQLTQLEHLYLEGNKLSCLPDTFFHCLPNLKWLDLRRNCLVNLPSIYIGRHKNLRNLLLEGNELRTLPLELGSVSTLHGLNIANNPLEFPPIKVIESGSQIILAFLGELLRVKSEGRIPNLMDLDITVPSIGDHKMNNDSDDSENEDYKHTYNSNKQRSWQADPTEACCRPQSGVRQSGAPKEHSDLVGPVPSSASLHQPPNYNERKSIQAERIRRAGASGQLLKKKKSERQRSFDRSVSAEKVEDKYLEERRLAYEREMNEKEDAVLQKRRDTEAVKGWRNEGKNLQQMKMREKMMKGGKLDYEEPATQAPFGYEHNDLRMLSNKERIAQEIRSKHEKVRRAQSPASAMKLEEARKERYLELQEKLMGHMAGMKERRKQPQGTPQEEMIAAQQELQIIKQIQQEFKEKYSSSSAL